MEEVVLIRSDSLSHWAVGTGWAEMRAEMKSSCSEEWVGRGPW